MEPSHVQPAHESRDLDPDVERFTREIAAGFAHYPSFATLSPPEARRAAEAVRAPWRAGGPRMLRTQEAMVPARHGVVRVRLHDPGPPGAKPGLVYLHGGGWTLFSLDTHDRVMREYAARAGVVVIGVDYPLSPEARFPVALEQVVDVVRWLGTHGADFDVDASRLAIGGDSAGANLSVATAIVLREAGEPRRLRALLLAYGAFDPDCSDEAERRWGGPGAVLNRDEMDGFWRNYLPGGLPDDRSAGAALPPLACPLRADLRGLPPACLTIPECDLLSEQSHALARQLRAAGVPVREDVYRGATHSFLEAVSIAPLAARALQDGADWLRGVLATP